MLSTTRGGALQAIGSMNIRAAMIVVRSLDLEIIGILTVYLDESAK
jgi:hypothetical protein